MNVSNRLRRPSLSLIALGLAALTACKPAGERSDAPNPSAASTTVSNSASSRHTNRLAQEKSPYLRQHMHNPVDWFPWGEAAFAKARAENKPIFLSIGYSTCHWCHVMERESFENEEVAKFLNEHFVSIKVDREERPDVDKIYMSAVQVMTGSGGWPLNVFLTHELKPFYGGTYFPPEEKYGRPSFLQLLANLKEVWDTQRDKVNKAAGDLFTRIEGLTTKTAGTNVLQEAILTNAAAQLMEDYEPRHGGYSVSPKFPRPSVPRFLLRHGVKHKDQTAINQVLFTCDKMAAGGINDQLGGGFARYSVDAQWLVPHFEKMLYDNAQLVQLYLDAYLVSGEKRHADVARDILRYVQRDMTHAEGGFYSAEDADSEGHEGKFYCWTKRELSALLTPEEFNVAVGYFGITEDGNFVDHSHPQPLANQNVLSLANPKLRPGDDALLASAKAKMFAARSQRVRPHLDDKILASWNGLMLGAVARAGIVLNDPAYLAAAEKNVAFLKTHLWDAKSKTLYHRWRDGERDSVQLLDAYAYLISGVIDLYEATLKPEHLEFALALTDTMLAKFYDPANGGFWQSPAGSGDLILRVKEDYDGAEPSGNAIAIMDLLRLAAICDRKDFRDAGDKSLRLFAERMQRIPQAVPAMLQGLAFLLEEPRRVVIAGDANSAAARSLLVAAHGVYQPLKVVLGTAGPVEAFAKTLPAKDGPVVYLCTGTACQPPTSEPAKIMALLR